MKDKLVLNQTMNQNIDVCYRDNLTLRTVVANFSDEEYKNLHLIIAAKPYYDVANELDSNVVLVKRRLHTAIYTIPHLPVNATASVKQELKTIGFAKITAQAILCDSSFKVIKRIQCAE